MAASAAGQGGLFSLTGRQWLILLMVQLSNLLFGMTITLANLVLPQVRGTLSATQDEISWVITLNLVATAVATPMKLAVEKTDADAKLCGHGGLGDRFGTVSSGFFAFGALS